MGILDNLENSWELEVPEPTQFESSPMVETDSMGREKFWQEDQNLAVKLFSETCCTNCSCKPE
jgi:hypothetical protein